MPLSLRLEGETDDEFRSRAESRLLIAKRLVSACLDNDCVQQYIADNDLPEYLSLIHI